MDMGFGGISAWQLLILLLIVVMIFGTRRLRNLGGDLGAAVKGFKKSMKDEEEEPAEPAQLIENDSAAAGDKQETGSANNS